MEAGAGAELGLPHSALGAMGGVRVRACVRMYVCVCVCVCAPVRMHVL